NDKMVALLAEPSVYSRLALDTQAELVVMSARHTPAFQSDASAEIQFFEEWEERWRAQGFAPASLVRACQVRTLAFAGQAREALAAAEPLTHSRTVGAHWHSVSSRTYEAFMYMQRGEF